MNNNQTEDRVWKSYVVRHHMKNSPTWRAVGYFDSIHEALKEFDELRQTYRRERVWVVELDSGQIVVDSHPRRR